ncbi:MAG TPA: MFS transporter [Candidatus Limnocylindrales bacterium]|nr:MFS transporter [Candidatus Limnocylindrales bacterium]
MLAVPLFRPAASRARPVRPLLGIDRGGWLLFWAQGLSGLGTGPFTVFAAIYQKQLGASAIEIGLIAAVGTLLGTLAMIPGTRLAEAYHLRPVLLAGWLLAVPAPLCYALAPQWAMLAVGSAFMGLSVCNTPAMNVYLTLGVPRDRLAMVMTFVNSSFSIGLIVSTIAAGALAQWMGIRWLFAISLVLFALATVCVGFLPRKTLPAEVHVRLPYRQLFERRAFVMLMALFSFMTVVIFIPWTFLPLYAKEVGHMDDLGVGTLIAVLFSGSVLAGIVLSGLRRRIGSFAVILAFEVLFVVSGLALLGARTFPLLVVACFLRGGFWSFRQVMTAVIGEVLPANALAKGYGVFALITGTAAAIAYPIGGWMYSHGPLTPFWASAALMGGGLLLTGLLRAHFRAGEAPAGRQASPPERVLPEAA